MFRFRQATVFLFGTPLRGRYGPLAPPGHAYVTRVAKNAKRASMRKYLRGLGKLCSSAAYNHGPLTIQSIKYGMRLCGELVA